MRTRVMERAIASQVEILKALTKVETEDSEYTSVSTAVKYYKHRDIEVVVKVKISEDF